MGGFNEPPGSGSVGLPDVPTPNYTTIAQQQTAGMQAAGWFDTFWKAFWEHALPGFGALISLVASVSDSIFASGMDLLTKLQGVNSPGFFSLMASTINGFLGTSMTGSQFQSAFAAGGGQGALRSIGGGILSTLVNELTTQPLATGAPGVSAASAWLGYVAEFAIREGNMAFLVEALPQEFRIFEGLREYGVNLANGLGLGRLSRLALTPLMKILIADPLTWSLNTQYTPTILPEASLVKSLWRGGITQDEFNTFMGYLGYRPVDVPQVMLDAQTLPSINSFVAGLRTNYFNAQDYQAALVAHGVPTTAQDQYNLAIEAGRAETRLNGAVNNYQTLFKNRWIAEDDLGNQLQQLGLSQTEIGWVKAEVAPLMEYQTKELSLAELTDAYIAGLITIDRIADWATRFGYTPADSQILQYQVLLKANKEQTSATLTAWRNRIACLDAIAKGQPPEPGFDAKCNPI